MSVQHGGNGDTAVIETFMEALKQRIGADPYRSWFTQGVSCTLVGPHREGTDAEQPGSKLLVLIRGQFALDRIRKNFMSPIRAAAYSAVGERCLVELQLDAAEPVQADLPLDDESESETPRPRPVRPSAERKRRTYRRRKTKSIGSLLGQSERSQENRRARIDQPELPNLNQANAPSVPTSITTGEPAPSSEGTHDAAEAEQSTVSDIDRMTAGSFVAGPCNRLAYTAMQMVTQAPGTASPLFLCGPSGTGKTHMLKAIASQFRRRHRMKRVIQLSAEQFTNDFVNSVGNSGIASFRRRYRDVDALLVDDVQFLGAKRATLREMLYTVETLAADGRPMVFAGNQSPTEIPGLTRELAGRLASGLLCPMQPLDQVTRQTLLRATLAERCEMEVPETIVNALNVMLIGDGRVIRGIANLINTLQRMYSRMPTLEEIRQFGGDLLRAAKPMATLTAIEYAVCQTFQLPEDSLRNSSQSRALSEPRMLAMHLSRQLTSAAYSDIGGHFGGRSHSTAITAGKNVRKWLSSGKTIGRGTSELTVQEAIDRIESLLRTG